MSGNKDVNGAEGRRKMRQIAARAGRMCLALGHVGIVMSQVPSEQIIESRIANYREIGTAYKRIDDELKSGRPDQGKILEAARLIKSRGAYMLTWFPPGSVPPPQPAKSWFDTIMGWFSSTDSVALPTGSQSHAKPVIWSDWERFRKLHEEFTVQAARMEQAARTGQAQVIAAQLKNFGQTCKSCHDAFREKVD